MPYRLLAAAVGIAATRSAAVSIAATRSAAVSIAAAVCIPAFALAGDWAGTVETRNGVPHVMNPADPVHPPAVLELEELWRLGGNTDADEEFFGVVNDVVVDDAGDVYVLDPGGHLKLPHLWPGQTPPPG
jgi:hypothetical protein